MKKVYMKRNDLFKNIPMILCNNITSVDEGFIEGNYELFYSECEACLGDGEVTVPCEGDEDNKETCEECFGEGRHDCEPYQYFIASMNRYDEELLREYDVPYGYSEALDVFIIPIYDFGTSWSAFSYSKEVEDDYQLSFNETWERKTHY